VSVFVCEHAIFFHAVSSSGSSAIACAMASASRVLPQPEAPLKSRV